MKLEDLLHQTNFPWRLRTLMSLADIRAGELSSESGVCIKTIYNTRVGLIMPEKAVRTRLLLAVEKWHPGALDMMRAAEQRRLKATT